MISERMKQIKPSATLALAAKARELKAEGHDVISLSVGEPDWDTFPSISEAGIAAIKEGQTKYAPSNGLPELRAAICEQTNSDFKTDYTPDQVTVTAGGKFTIFSAIQSVINPGDEVIIPAPYWVSYPTMVEMAGGVPVFVECPRETGFTLTAESLEKAITAKTKMIIFNSPSNPTGAMYSPERIEEVGRVLEKHSQVLILSDDIYNRLAFVDCGVAPHLLHMTPSLKDRILVMNGVSKTYSMTGWRLGWALGPKEWVGAMNKYQSQTVSCAAPFTQKAALAAIKNGQAELDASLVELKKRRDLVYKWLSEIDGLEVDAPDGAFYIFPDFRKFLGKSFNGKKLETSRDLAAALLEDQMVVAVPGIEFGLDGFMRISYALNEERMREAVNRIQKFLSTIV